MCRIQKLIRHCRNCIFKNVGCFNPFCRKYLKTFTGVLKIKRFIYMRIVINIFENWVRLTEKFHQRLKMLNTKTTENHLVFFPHKFYWRPPCVTEISRAIWTFEMSKMWLKVMVNGKYTPTTTRTIESVVAPTIYYVGIMFIFDYWLFTNNYWLTFSITDYQLWTIYYFCYCWLLTWQLSTIDYQLL